MKTLHSLLSILFFPDDFVHVKIVINEIITLLWFSYFVAIVFSHELLPI